MTNVPNSNLLFNKSIYKIGFITFLLIFFNIQLLFGQTPEPDQELPSQNLQGQQTEESNPTEIEELTPELPTTITSDVTDQEDKQIGGNQETDEKTPQTFEEGQSQGEASDDSKLQPVDEDQTESGETNITTPLVEEDNQFTDDSLQDNEKTWKGKHRIFKLVNDYQVKSDEILTTLVMIAGNASIHGTVTGNVLIIGGNVELASGAYIKGKLQVIGGQVIGDRQYVENISQDNGWHIIPAATKILMHPPYCLGFKET